MFNKRNIALILTGLLLFAMLASGGCLGDSDKAKTLVVLSGSISDADTTTLKESGVELTDYSEEKLTKHRNIIIQDYSSLETSNSDRLDAVKKMFAETADASVTLYHPTKEEITKLQTLLGTDNTVLPDEDTSKNDETSTKDLDLTMRVFTIAKDDNGNIHSAIQYIQGLDAKYTPTSDTPMRNDSIRKEDITDGYVWVRYNKNNSTDAPYDVLTYTLSDAKKDSHGDEYYKREGKTDEYYEIVGETVLGKVAESAVKVDTNNNTITVKLSDGTHPCLKFQKQNYGYTLMRPGVELPENMQTCIYEASIPVTDEEKKAAGMMTDAEKMTAAGKTSMQRFAQWLTKDRYKEQQTVADMGLVKPKTVFGKMLAFVKNLFGGSDIAFADDTMPDIYDVATITVATIGTSFANVPGPYIGSTAYIVSVHHFDGTTNEDGGEDYYFVKQQLTLNPTCDQRRHWYEGSYYNRAKLPWDFGEDHDYWIGGAECDEFYAQCYQVKASIEDVTEGNISHLTAPSPQAYNNETTHMSSHGWSIGAGAQAGVSKGELGLSLDAGYSSTKTTMYSTPDVDCTLDAIYHKATWTYPVTVLPKRGSPWTKVTYPCNLAISTYGPATAAAWNIKTSARDTYKTFWQQTGFRLEGCYSKNSGSLKPRYWNHWIGTQGRCNLQKPPLFCLSKDTINFDEETKKTDYITIYSQGAWTWDATTVPDWLTLIDTTASNSQLTIETKPNTTGAVRTATIKVYRKNAKEKWDTRTITVTQSAYSNTK